MSEIRCIGFIGIGKMGFPIAGHIAKAGFELIVADLSAEAVARFTAEHGGRTAPSLEALGRDADAVITMLPDGKAVRSVIVGHGGDAVAEGLRPEMVVLDMSTSSPADTLSLGADLMKRRVHTVDAPVAGGVRFAHDGTLSITVGGESSIVERCRPLLEAAGSTVIHCGPLGTGHAMKALQNYVNAAGFIAQLEAMAIGRRYGIEVDTMVAALKNATTGRNAPLLKKVIPHVLTRRFGTGMAMGLIAKDVKIAVDAGDAVGVRTDLARCTFELWHEAVQTYGFDLDQAEVVRLWEDAAGVVLKGDEPAPE